MFGKYLIDLVADWLVMTAIEKRLTASQHGRCVARLAAVLVLDQQQVQVALSRLVVAVAVLALPMFVLRGQQRLAVRADQFKHQVSSRSSVAS